MRKRIKILELYKKGGRTILKTLYCTPAKGVSRGWQGRRRNPSIPQAGERKCKIKGYLTLFYEGLLLLTAAQNVLKAIKLKDDENDNGNDDYDNEDEDDDDYDDEDDNNDEDNYKL